LSSNSDFFSPEIERTPFDYGRFERRIPLEGVDEDKTSAAFKNGVLTITLPKSAESKSNVRRIAINRNG
jgi:HSP20 family protein